MLAIKNLKLPYLNKIIKDYSFIEGNIYHIEAKNGMGKSILLDCLAGLYRKKDIKNAVTGNDSIIYINQDISFYNKLTSKDLLKYIYKIYGEKVTNFYEFINKFSVEINIETLLNKKLGSLSGGEIKFLMYLILLSIDTKWYILDEPFNSLDKDKKTMLISILDYLKKEENKGIIITSHEPILIEHISLHLEEIYNN